MRRAGMASDAGGSAHEGYRIGWDVVILNILSEHCFLLLYEVSGYTVAQHSKNPAKCAAFVYHGTRRSTYGCWRRSVIYEALVLQCPKPNAKARCTGFALKCGVWVT